MTIVKLGYVAMSVNIQNCSPSQTMTYTQFSKLEQRQAAIHRLERIAQSNLANCLRLLKHNEAHDIRFFRLSSRLVPLATHEALKDWNYIEPIKKDLEQLGQYAQEKNMRIDFHPDHFALLNSPREEVLRQTLDTLKHHYYLLKGMSIEPTHRCVLHVGGLYKNKEEALERFIQNWSGVPYPIQKMIMLENDDKSFTLQDTLYLSEKLGIPLVFDYHHHLANHLEQDWLDDWERVIDTWLHSHLPIKMHISSPKNEKQYRHHADYIDVEMFMQFLNQMKGSVPEIDCIIEAKQKDGALFQLVKQLKNRPEIEMIDQASFYIS